eukprot:SAG31_NODE_2700_length_5224_cov_2.317854_7_plen_72_part_00
MTREARTTPHGEVKLTDEEQQQSVDPVRYHSRSGDAEGNQAPVAAQRMHDHVVHLVRNPPNEKCCQWDCKG